MTNRAALAPLIGSSAQIEWAEPIRIRVGEEFERVANTLRGVALRQTTERRAGTEEILAILEEKRVAVMARDQAGYFIHDWGEIGGQVQRMLANDSRFLEIRARWQSGRS